MSVPVFIDLESSDQISEIRSYLKGKGADVAEENASDGLRSDLTQAILGVSVLWKEVQSDTEVEGILNSLVSLMMYLPQDENPAICRMFCKNIGDVENKRPMIQIRVLNNLFHMLGESSPLRYEVYMNMVHLATTQDTIQLVNPTIDQVKRWIGQWDVTTAQVQSLWRGLYDAFQETKQREMATKVMIELLGTYTEENASQAREDAHRCIVTSLAAPATFLMDHLLSLKPVKFLEGELIHDLLTIFVSGKLAQYLKFYETNKDFVNSIGLNHEENMQKMRLLTFMQMGETQEEIDFDTVQEELVLQPDEVECFIIDVVRTKAVRCKIDQMARKVVISSTTHRTFGKQQWQLLREQLVSWQHSLDNVLQSLQSLSHH